MTTAPNAAADSKNTTEGTPTVMTPAELAEVVKLVRSARGWSQEQLAEIAGVTVRTVQRVEHGEPSGLDTRRALARAFDAPDIDAFNKPFVRITEEQAKAAKEKFDREHITLDALPLDTGRKFAELAESTQADYFHAAVELPPDAERIFAGLTDYFREYRGSYDLYSEVDKLDLHKELQERIDELRSHKFSLRHALRVTPVDRVGNLVAPQPFDWPVVYVAAFPLGQEPPVVIVPRKVEFKI